MAEMKYFICSVNEEELDEWKTKTPTDNKYKYIFERVGRAKVWKVYVVEK